MSIRVKDFTIRALIVAVAGCGFATQAWAIPLAPGSGPTVTPGLASFAGLSAIADETNVFSGTDAFLAVHFSGTLESTVYMTPGGTLDFAYHVISNGGEPDAISAVSVNSYTGFLTDVDYVAGTGNVTYGSANRLAAPAGGGDTINFDFTPNPINPGFSADWILVATNATAFDNLGTTNFEDGGSGSVVSFEPAVPEPMSISLLLLGGSVLMSRRPGRKI